MTMRRALPYLCALVAGTGAGLLVGCGSDRSGLIPPQSASDLRSTLKAVEAAAAGGDCGQSDAALTQARSTVAKLPAGVDNRLVARLKEGLKRLADKADTECKKNAETTTTEVQTTTTTTPPPTTPPAPTTTQAPTTTSTPTTPKTTPKTTPNGGGGGGVAPPTPSTSTPPSGGVAPGAGSGQGQGQGQGKGDGGG